MNTLLLIGNVGNDVKVKTFENGNITASVSLATNETYTNHAGEKLEETQWHNVVAFGKTAEYLQKNVKKGDSLAVEGRIKYRSYENTENVKVWVTEIFAKKITHFSKSNSNISNEEE